MTDPATPPVPPTGTAPGFIPTQGYQIPPGYGPTPPVYYYRPAPPPVAADGRPLAEAGDRLVAWLIDSALIFVAMLIPGVPVFYWVIRRAIDTINANLPPASSDVQFQTGPLFRPLFESEAVAVAVLLPFSVLITYLYFVIYMARTGQTLGKKIMKITTVRQVDGGPISRIQARKRWLVMSISSLVAPYFQYADLLWLLWDKPYRQCLHDKCAETVVVKVRGE
jgi:uncharacterized RDD family membrane protein YckC